jgi:hypothetical protein
MFYNTGEKAKEIEREIEATIRALGDKFSHHVCSFSFM